MNLIKTLTIFLFILGMHFSSTGQTTADQNGSETSLVKHTVKVKGATCKTDLGMIVDNVKKLEGVENCVIAKRGATSTLEVEYYTTEVDADAIKSAIENTGTCEDPNARRYKVKL